MPSVLGHVLGLGHIIVGVGAIIAPITTAAGFRIVQPASTAFITRAFGSRDVALGCGIQLYERDSPENRFAVLACGCIHGFDVLSAIFSYAQGYLPWEGMVTVCAIDSALTALCWLELNS